MKILMIVLLLCGTCSAGNYLTADCGGKKTRVDLRRIQDVGWGTYYEGDLKVTAVTIETPTTFKYDKKTGRGMPETHFVNVVCSDELRAEAEAERVLCRWRKHYGPSRFDFFHKEYHNDLIKTCRGY